MSDIIKEVKETPSFLREIYNNQITWTFQLVGALRVTGRVIDFLWDANGVPITLMVMPKGAHRVKPIEIPWFSVQTITFVSKPTDKE